MSSIYVELVLNIIIYSSEKRFPPTKERMTYKQLQNTKKKKCKNRYTIYTELIILCSIHNAYYNGGLARLLFITVGGRCMILRA